MPKKQNPETQKEQSERFIKAVRDLVGAGILNPTEADKSFENLMGKVALKKDA